MLAAKCRERRLFVNGSEPLIRRRVSDAGVPDGHAENLPVLLQYESGVREDVRALADGQRNGQLLIEPRAEAVLVRVCPPSWLLQAHRGWAGADERREELRIE